MKALVFLLLLLIPYVMTAQHTYFYELRLYEQFKHPSMWSEKERAIHQRHLSYLDNLTRKRKLQLAGIVAQDLEGHTGWVLLTTTTYEEARAIALNDPSVKEGMMSAKLRTIQIYFKNPNDP